MNRKNKHEKNPLHSEYLEHALQQRAKEDLERKAMEKARNEYNYEQYMKKKERAEAKARRKLRTQSQKKVVLFLIIILLICLYVYLYQQNIHITDLIYDFIDTINDLRGH